MATIAEALAQAVEYHQAGDVQRAEQIYRQIVQADPNHAETWCYLGVACLGAGRMEEAVAHYQRAIRIRPDHAAAHSDLGIALSQLNRRDEAVASLREALRLSPDAAETLNNLAVVLGQQGQFEESEKCYRRCLELKPDYIGAYNNISLVLKDLGKLDDAIACLREAIRLKPDYVDAYYNLGHMLTHQNKWEESLPYYREAVRLNPNYAQAQYGLGAALVKLGRNEEAAGHLRQTVQLTPNAPEAHHQLGNALLDLGKLDEALPHLQQATRLKPQDPYMVKDHGKGLVQWWQRAAERQPNDSETLNELGNVLKGQGRLDESVASYRRALELKPGSVETLNNLAAALSDQGKPEEAEKIYRQVLQLRPNFVEAISNLANVVKVQGRLDEAAEHYTRAIGLRPHDGEAHKARAMTWILQGKYEQGWKEYEWRWRCQEFHPRQQRQPQWDGSPLNGRRILLDMEQGLGDIIHFIRYAPLVKERGGIVVFECPRALCKLLARSPGIDRLVPQGCFLPDYDVHAPLLSLPGLFGTTLDNIPLDIPYLFPDPELVEKWKRELDSIDELSSPETTASGGVYPRRVARQDKPGGSLTSRTLRVGINWRGGATHTQDRHRSASLGTFAPLARLDGVRLFSLQKGLGIEELEHADFPVTDLGCRVESFADSAAILKNLDLLITVDTAIAHCAGGLGVPVWVALPFAPDWRWVFDREDSPWYPSMRLFRQNRWGDWDEVFARITAAIKSFSRDPQGSAGALSSPAGRA